MTLHAAPDERARTATIDFARALQCRQTAADPDALFPARTVLQWELSMM